MQQWFRGRERDLLGLYDRLRAGSTVRSRPGRTPVSPHPPAAEVFAVAESRYWELVQERARGALDARAFRAAVRELTLQDGDGREWVLGPEDGLWYRRDRDRWMIAEPPRRLVCGVCGHRNLLRHSYCVECGALLKAPANGIATATSDLGSRHPAKELGPSR